VGWSWYAGLLVVLVFGFTYARLRFVWAMAAAAVVVLAYEVVAIAVVHTPVDVLVSNHFFFLATAAVGALACYAMERSERHDFYLATLLGHEQQRLAAANEVIRRTFGRYLSDDVVDRLLEDPQGLAIGGDKRVVTILMTDLRGFTAISDRLPAEDVVRLINIYLEVMTEIIVEAGGTIDEFIGDAILVLFGAPDLHDDDAERAVGCALRMQLAMEAVNARLTGEGLPEVAMGIGLDTGEVVVGNIGSQRRAKYGVVGQHVNRAARIESLTLGGQVLMSESTRAACTSTLRVDGEREVLFKGMSQPQPVYLVGALGGPHGVALPEPVVHELVAVEPPLEVVVTPMRHKRDCGPECPGWVVRRGGDILELRCEARGDDYRLDVAQGAAWAKGLSQPASQEGCVRVALTSAPEEVRQALLA